MAFIKPGTLVVTPLHPTDRDPLTFKFVSTLDFADLTRMYGTTAHALYRPKGYGDSQWIDLPGGTMDMLPLFGTLTTERYNTVSATMTVTEPGLSAGEYDFAVVDQGDYNKLQPYDKTRIAIVSGMAIAPYSRPVENPVHIVVNPTPSDATVTIDSIPIRNKDVSAGSTIIIGVSKYGYTRYSESMTIPMSYAGQTASVEPVLEPCGISETYCNGYVEPVQTPDTNECASGDLLCQYKPYLPYIAIGAVVIFMMMQKPGGSGTRSQQSPVIIAGH